MISACPQFPLSVSQVHTLAYRDVHVALTHLECQQKSPPLILDRRRLVDVIALLATFATEYKARAHACVRGLRAVMFMRQTVSIHFNEIEATGRLYAHAILVRPSFSFRAHMPWAD